MRIESTVVAADSIWSHRYGGEKCSETQNEHGGPGESTPSRNGQLDEARRRGTDSIHAYSTHSRAYSIDAGQPQVKQPSQAPAGKAKEQSTK